MRSTWTDSRLDDFANSTDRRLDELSGRVSDLARRVDSGFDRVDARIDSLQRTMMQVGGGVIVALIGLIATQL